MKSRIVALENGGQLEIRDWGEEIVIDVSFPAEKDAITISEMELTGHELQVCIRERFS